MSVIAIFWIAASDDLGGRIWGHPVPLNRGRWTTLKSCLDLEKCFLLCFFDTPNSTCEVTASEAAEAGLIVTMTWPTLSTTHMQSFNLLALKLWICIAHTRNYRQLLRFTYKVRFSSDNVVESTESFWRSIYSTVLCYDFLFLSNLVVVTSTLKYLVKSHRSLRGMNQQPTFLFLSYLLRELTKSR